MPEITSSEFVKEYVRNSKGGYKKARQQTFQEQLLPEGVYLGTLITSKLGRDKNGNINVRFGLSVMEPQDLKNKRCSIYYGLHKTPWQTMQEAEERFYRTLQTLGYDTAEMEPTDLPEVIETLEKEQPRVSFRVKHNVSKKNGKTYQQVYINQLVEDLTETEEDSSEFNVLDDSYVDDVLEDDLSEAE